MKINKFNLIIELSDRFVIYFLGFRLKCNKIARKTVDNFYFKIKLPVLSLIFHKTDWRLTFLSETNFT